MFGLGAQEMLLLVLLGVLLFGKRLPEVGRSLGKTVMEFTNGLKGMEDEFATAFRESDERKPTPNPQISIPTPAQPVESHTTA